MKTLKKIFTDGYGNTFTTKWINLCSDEECGCEGADMFIFDNTGCKLDETSDYFGGFATYDELFDNMQETDEQITK